MATRDPDDPLAVGSVIAAASVAVACAVALVGLALGERWGVGRRYRRRALRRAAELGTVVAALALLRAVDGLTMITGGFVVAGFALAELALAARPRARSG